MIHCPISVGWFLPTHHHIPFWINNNQKIFAVFSVEHSTTEMPKKILNTLTTD